MNTTLVVAVIVAMVGIGLYFGLTNLATQYALEPSGGLASGAACAPNVAETRPNQAVTFTVSGLPANTTYHWASDQGTSMVAADGSFDVRFATIGAKMVYVFYGAEGRWYRTSCSVLVR
jgi:hypothetical protein